MFDIGFWELSLIGIVALLVIGPEKLPGVAKTVGNFVGKAQRYVQNVKSDIKREFDADDLMRMMEDQKKTIERLETNIQESTNIIAKESQEIAQSIDDGDKEGDGISYKDILKLNIPTGQPLIYELDDNLKPLKHYYLGDEDAIKKAMESVANQGKAK